MNRTPINGNPSGLPANQGIYSSNQHPRYHPSSSAPNSNATSASSANTGTGIGTSMPANASTTNPSSSTHMAGHYSMSGMPMTNMNVSE